MLLLEAGRDTPPDDMPEDVRDTYPVSYFNDAYMWPGLKVHWRLRHNSPKVGFSQARIMGGGCSVMGMVALRGTPDDYNEWEALGAAGWGWNDVLPFFRKLEADADFSGDCTERRAGADPPHSVSRTGRRSRARCMICAGAADSVHRRYERRFPRRLLLGANEQLAGQAGVLGDLLSRCVGAQSRRI